MPIVKLGAHVEIVSGYAFDAGSFGPSGNLPLVRIRDVVRGFSQTYYSGEFEDKYLLRDGDLLIGMDGDFNRGAWNGGPALLNQRVCKVIADPVTLDHRYLYHFLPAALKAIEMITPFATVKHLSVKTIREIAVPLPPLAEQRRIAAILDHAEAVRTQRRRALALLDELTAAIFVDLFGRHEVHPLFPEVSIGDLCLEIVDCVNKTAPVVPHETPYKMIRTTNVRRHRVDTSSVRYVDEDTFVKWTSRLQPKRGDVILTREAPAGEAGVIKSDEKIFLGQRLMGYRVNPERLLPDYLVHVLMGPWLRHKFNQASSGSTVKHLSVPFCRTFTLPLPPIGLQTQFVERLQEVEAMRTMHDQVLTTLDALFASLQHRAFRGEL